VFLLFLAAPLPASLSSGLGYAAGIVAHWLLSSRIVFRDVVAEAGPERVTQQALFLGSAAIGLALTMGIVGLGDLIGLDARLAKLVATGVSFHAVWLVRRHVVFA
jgi:putative flippase GtrA